MSNTLNETLPKPKLMTLVDLVSFEINLSGLKEHGSSNSSEFLNMSQKGNMIVVPWKKKEKKRGIPIE